jgi:protein-tyrosine phosphatase
MNTVLFLCTGNYYRSRFAEYLFNHQAAQQALKWQADSRGLALDRGTDNVGPISKYARAGLAERRIILPENLRFPQSVTEADFRTAHKIIALDESEHRPLMVARFPGWIDSVQYWLVHDIGETPAEFALHQIEQQVKQLLEQLGQDRR